MSQIAEMLRQHAFAKGFSDQMIATIAAFGSNATFAADDYIFREGGDADRFYLLRHGSVALETFAPGSGAFTFLTLRADEFLGVSWLTPPYRWAYDARALEVTRVIAFDAVALRGECDADHNLGYEVLSRFIGPLAARLQAARIQSADLYDAGGQ